MKTTNQRPSFPARLCQLILSLRQLVGDSATWRGALLLLTVTLVALPAYAGPEGEAAVTTLDLGSLNGPNGYRIDGRNPGDRAGRALSNAGDVNGDGLDDFIVGAATADPDGKQGAGEAYVVFGATTNPPSLSVAALNGANGFRVVGVTFNDAAGESVGGGGDVNGDGYDDVIVGAPGADPGEVSEAGSAYVVFGAPTFPARLNLADLNGQRGFRLDGAADEDGAGAAVGLAGDVNGDGYDDILVGAPNALVSGKAAAGRVYLVFGAAAFAPQLALAGLDGDDGFAIQGISAESYTGGSAGAAGDMNGDGYDDAFLSTWNGPTGPGDERGAVYVLLGKPAFPAKLDVDDLTGSAGFRAEGNAAGDHAGHAARAAGDVNGDGRDELVIGAPMVAGHRGEAYVVLGANAFPAVIPLGSLNGGNGFRLIGEATSDTGMAVGAADVNGDGLSDVVVSASAAGTGSGRFAGRSYVVFGRAGFSAAIDLASLTDATGLRIDGAAGGDQSGQAISPAGDSDGDGFDELLIGAPNAGIGPEGDLGQTYLVQGGPTLGVPLPVTHMGTPDNNVLWGGDGVDVILGDRGADTIGALGGDDALKGGAGQDTLAGGPGADRLVGGNGRDNASYNDSTVAVTVNLFTGAASGGDATGDRFTSIEGVIGSGDLDTLVGDAGPNFLDGGGNNDQMTGGAGNDAFAVRPQSRHDTITDFEPGAGSDDYLDFTKYPAVQDSDDLTVQAEGGNTRITLPGEATFLLLGVAPGALHGDDYRFAGAPLAAPDQFSTPANTPLTVAAPGVLGNDENPSAMPLSAVLVDGPDHGTLSLKNNGSFTYTPAQNFLGVDGFTYRANNGQNSNIAHVTLAVTPRPPAAVNDTFTAELGQTLTVPAPGVLGNDQNPGGAPLAAQLIDGPVEGTLTLNANGSFSYTPTVDLPTQDSFTYVATNGLTSNVATVTINVLDPNGPPIAVDDSYTAQAGKSLTIAAPGVLGNDINPLPGAMTAILAAGPAHGTLTLNANGSFTYTPQSGYVGADQFTYRAGNGQPSDVATVRLTITSTGYRLALPVVFGD